MSGDIAQEIIEKYFLPQNEHIKSVERQEETALVTTSVGTWRVMLYTEGRNYKENAAYKLYDINRTGFVDPGLRSAGVAILPGGDKFFLNAENEFCHFFAEIHHSLTSLELALLLSRYQGNKELPYLLAPQNLVLSKENLKERVREEELTSLENINPFEETLSDNGLLQLDFITFYLERQPTTKVYTTGLNRWLVKETSRNKLEWSVVSLARLLTNPLYSPK